MLLSVFLHNVTVGRQMKTTRVSALACFMLFCWNPALSIEEVDLIGVWQLCVDPDQNPKDSMHFESDSSGYIVRRDRPNIDFRYQVDGSSLMLFATVGEREIPVSFEISPDGRKLLLYSDRTRNTSFYVRESDVAKFNCD